MAEDYPDPPTEPVSLSPDALQRKLDADEPVRILDVRDRDEYERWHVDGPSVTATQRPFAKFLQAKVTGEVEPLVDGLDGDGPRTVVCARGEASAFVAGLLEANGVDAQNLAGGMAAWARLYDAREVPCQAATVLQYRRPSSGCLGYLLVDGNEAAVVDPLRAFTERYQADAAEHGATLRYAVDTHVHADHVSGLRRLAEGGVEPVMPASAVERGVEYDVRALDDEDTLTVGSAAVRAVSLPGHTTGMTGFTVGDVLLTGDSLFLESVARPDLQSGEDGARDLARELYRTLTERLSAFDDDVVVAPGHYSERADPADDGTYTATLGALRARLPVFRLDEAAFVERVCADIPPRPANADRVVALNLGRETADDATAFDLELGPNNCAAAALES